MPPDLSPILYKLFYLLNTLSKISPYFISLGVWACQRFKNRLWWRAPWVRTFSPHLYPKPPPKCSPTGSGGGGQL